MCGLPSPMCLERVRLRENNHTRRVAMQEVPPSDRADLALGKESCRGNGSEPSLHGSNIVVGSTEEPLTAPATTEQKGPKRGMPVRGSIRRQEEVQVIACRLCVTKVELDSLALLHNVSNRDGSGLLIRSDEIPNKEVAPLEMAPLLLDRNAKMQCPMRIATVDPSSDSKTSWSLVKAATPPSS